MLFLPAPRLEGGDLDEELLLFMGYSLTLGCPPSLTLTWQVLILFQNLQKAFDQDCEAMFLHQWKPKSS